MPNIKSAKKLLKLQEKRRQRNLAVRSRVKTAIRKLNLAIAAGELETAKDAYVNVARLLDKAATKGVVHKNTASRYKSRLMLKINKTLISSTG